MRTERIDLRALDESTRAALAHATSQAAAQEIVRGFVDAFHDRHFKATVGDLVRAEGGTATTIAAGASWQVACAALGTSLTRPPRHPIAWNTLGAAYEALPSTIAGLDTGLVRTAPDRPPIAVLRVSLFMGTGYPELCERAWTARTPTACDATCQDELSQKLDQLLIDEIAARVRALADAKPRALLLDVTGNGGGTGMVEPVARMLTDRALRRPAMGFIRQPHWQVQFAETRDALRAELGKAVSPELRALLERSAARAEAARLDATRPCNLSSTWQSREAAFPCSAVGRFDGYLDAGERPDVSTLDTRGVFGDEAGYTYEHAIWKGPLLVLVDGKSASATEQLAAALQDYGGATVIGQRTLGIGCGYTNGGTHLELQHLGLAVRAPDCIRYRADGSSESAGVSPTIAIDWKPSDDAAARATRVLGSLSTL